MVSEGSGARIGAQDCMQTRWTTLVALAAMAGGCFSPEADPDLESVDASTSSGSSTSVGPSTGSTGDPTTTTEPAGTTTSADSTGTPTVTDPTSDPTRETTSGGEDPYCGDGNVDPGEECDDGLDNNGLDRGCLPDCNLNVCGDGNLGPDEFCDDGADDNLLEVGACAPDCSTVVEEKVIRLSNSFGGGNHQPNPVGFADSRCAVGSRALFTVPGVRQATDGTPNAADDPIDWPLRPFTAYVRSDGTPIWTTDETPLLGIRNGAVMDLTNSIYPVCDADPEFCFLQGWPVVTGMLQDWRPAASDTCNGWSSNSPDLDFAVGQKISVTAFLDEGQRACSTATGGLILAGTQPVFYCVEQ